MVKGERIFAVVFGLFLLGTGLYLLMLAETTDAWGFIGIAVLVALGGNLLYATYKAKPSWLSRLGPLP